jgi:hypothetical protein
MKRALMLAAATTLALGCGPVGELDNSQEALGRCDGGTCVADGGHDGGGGDGCDGDEADAGLLCGLCGPGIPCREGVCIGGVCRPEGDGGIVDGGHGGTPDAGIGCDAGLSCEGDGGVADGGGSDGCDGDEADAGFLCGLCGPGISCREGVCIGGVCRAEGDGGRPDAG